MERQDKRIRYLRFLKFWFPVFIYAGIIFAGSSVESVKVTPGPIPVDKALHLIEYFLFGYLLARSVKNTTQKSSLGVWILVLMVSFLYGLSDEFHQYFVPGRDASLGDLVADTVGGGIGGFLYLFLSVGFYSSKELKHEPN